MAGDAACRDELARDELDNGNAPEGYRAGGAVQRCYKGATKL